MATQLTETWENLPCGLGPPPPLESGWALVQVQSRHWIGTTLQATSPRFGMGFQESPVQFAGGRKGVAVDTDI